MLGGWGAKHLVQSGDAVVVCEPTPIIVEGGGQSERARGSREHDTTVPV